MLHKGALLFVLLVVLTGVLGGYLYLDVASEFDDQVRAQTTETTELHATVYADWHADRHDELTAITRDERIQRRETAALSRYLQSAQEESTFEALHVVDVRTGIITASSEPNRTETSIYTYIDKDVVRSGHVSTQYRTPDGGRVVATVERTSDLPFLAVVGESAATGVRSTHGSVFEGTESGVVTANGAAVVGPATLNGTVPPQNLEEGAIHHSHQTDDIVTTTRLSTDGGQALFVVTRTPRGEAYALRRTMLTHFGTTLLLSLVAVGIVGAVLGRRLTTHLRHLSEQVAAIQDGSLSADFETTRTDELGTLYRQLGSMRDTIQQQLQTLAEQQDEAQGARHEAERKCKRLEQQAVGYRDTIETVTAGDLTARLATTGTETETETETGTENVLTALGQEVNEVLDEVQAPIRESDHLTTAVKRAGDAVSESCTDATDASKRMSNSAQQIVTSARRQDESLQSVQGTLSDLSRAASQVTDAATQGVDVTEEATDTSHQGRTAAQDALEGLSEIEADAESAIAAIESLESTLETIDSRLASIEDRAEQTTMLALNANIEASRTGGSGNTDGFGAVTKEIKDLSNETKDDVEAITAHTDDLHEQLDRALKALSETREQAATERQTITQAGEALDQLRTYSEQIHARLEEITTTSEQQETHTDQVHTVVDHTASIAEETAAEAQAITATAQEQTIALTDVRTTVTDLSSKAAQLSSTLEKFDTGRSLSDSGWESDASGFTWNTGDAVDLDE